MSNKKTKRTEANNVTDPKRNPYTIDVTKNNKNTNAMIEEKDGIRAVGGA